MKGKFRKSKKRNTIKGLIFIALLFILIYLIGEVDAWVANFMNS
ncbi:MAG: hypothetical protein ACPGRE_06385 [Flavobacteriaceae bacterium]